MESQKTLEAYRSVNSSACGSLRMLVELCITCGPSTVSTKRLPPASMSDCMYQGANCGFAGSGRIVRMFFVLGKLARNRSAKRLIRCSASLTVTPSLGVNAGSSVSSSSLLSQTRPFACVHVFAQSALAAVGLGVCVMLLSCCFGVCCGADLLVIMLLSPIVGELVSALYSLCDLLMMEVSSLCFVVQVGRLCPSPCVSRMMLFGVGLLRMWPSSRPFPCLCQLESHSFVSRF